MVELVGLDSRDLLDELDAVDYVEWQLHPTFTNPIRRITNRRTNFRLDTGGWGVFMIRASARRKDGTTENLQYFLQLHFPYGYRENDLNRFCRSAVAFTDQRSSAAAAAIPS